MPRLLMLVSSAREITLADGAQHETGFFAEEAIIPYERFAAAGVEVIVATPDGRPPYPDSYGLEPIFHYPDEDEDFLASVTRTFMPGRRIAWREDRDFGAVLIDDGLAAPLTPEQVRAAIDELMHDAQAHSDDVAARLSAVPGFARPVNLAAMSGDEIRSLDAVFVPGGHEPMVDLADNPDVTRVLRLLQEKKPSSAPCATARLSCCRPRPGPMASGCSTGTG